MLDDILLTRHLTCPRCEVRLGFEVNFCPYCGGAREERQRPADAVPNLSPGNPPATPSMSATTKPIPMLADQEPAEFERAPVVHHRRLVIAVAAGCIVLAGAGGITLWPRLNPSESKPADRSVGRSETAEDLVRRAHEDIAAGRISNAQVLLRQAKDYPYNYAPALIELAHLDDPNQCPPPYKDRAHPTMAARYYREAEAKGAMFAHEDREKLRGLLEKRADGGDYEAKAALQAYWP